jgi:hypothetical protein
LLAPDKYPDTETLDRAASYPVLAVARRLTWVIRLVGLSAWLLGDAAAARA